MLFLAPGSYVGSMHYVVKLRERKTTDLELYLSTQALKRLVLFALEMCNIKSSLVINDKR